MVFRKILLRLRIPNLINIKTIYNKVKYINTKITKNYLKNQLIKLIKTTVK